MRLKTFYCMIMIGILAAAVFLTGAVTIQDTTTLETKKSSLLNLELYDDKGMMSTENKAVLFKPTDVVSKFGYGLIKKSEKKTGDLAGEEMGLYWNRGTIQMLLYPDVQEICEEAFGDYLSPLQGLTEIVSGISDKYIRYRTDKQTAVIGTGRVEFYLFIGDKIALVTIEDKKDTYDTSFQILRDKEAKGIKVLEVPPPGGIGIAGTEHRPEELNYDTHRVTTNGEIIYSKADIQLVFSAELQEMEKGIFGNYVQSLQGLYMLTEQEGYGKPSPFWVEDMTSYLYHGHFETTVIKDNYCEFTLLLEYPNRARVTIAKEGEQYITTFRLLKEGEFETQVQAG